MMGNHEDPQGRGGRLQRWLRWSALGGVAAGLALAAASCGGSAGGGPPLLQSNTNWLQRCGPDAPCSGALLCLCGMCTQPCSETTECGRLEGAACGGTCEGAASGGGGLCVLGCATDDDCGSDFTCVAAECRPRPPALEEQALGDEQVGTAGACTNAFVSLDSVFERARADLDALDADDQPYVRYLSLANRSDAGACAAELDGDRLALGKLLNATSLDTALTLPVPIDADRLLYRIDLRDYTWDTPRTLAGVPYDTAWDLLVQSTPYALAFEGPDASALAEQTVTAVPLLQADALIHAAARGETYMALLQQPTTLAELLEELGVDAEANRREGAARRAATTRSRVSRADRLLERHELEVRAGVLWLTLDFLPETQGDLLASPLQTTPESGTVTYTLPNGLPGFGLYDADGLLRPDSDLLLDTNQANFRALTGISCMNCHTETIVPAVDEARSYAETNPQRFSAEERRQITELYPEPGAWIELMARDNAAFRSASENLGLARGGVDPVATVVYRFERDMTPAEMAGDLMLPPSDVQALESALGIDVISTRSSFEQRLVENLCVSLATQRNRPRACALP